MVNVRIRNNLSVPERPAHMSAEKTNMVINTIIDLGASTDVKQRSASRLVQRPVSYLLLTNREAMKKISDAIVVQRSASHSLVLTKRKTMRKNSTSTLMCIRLATFGVTPSDNRICRRSDSVFYLSLEREHDFVN